MISNNYQEALERCSDEKEKSRTINNITEEYKEKMLHELFHNVFEKEPSRGCFHFEWYPSWGDYSCGPDIRKKAIVEGDETGIRIWFKLKEVK